MSYCGVMEVRSLEDALGTTCGRTADVECSDCGTLLCSAHSERCELCDETFCPSYLSFHMREHGKPTRRDQLGMQKRKSA